MQVARRCKGFTLVEALVVIAILGIALVPILSASRRILFAARRGERRAALAEIAESRLAAAGARLAAMRPAPSRQPAAASGSAPAAATPREWRESGSIDGAFWTIHARPLESAGGVTRWRIDAAARDPDGASEATFREYLEPAAQAGEGGGASAP